MFRLTLIAVLAIFASCSAQQCPFFDSVGDLDLAKHLGTWQIHGIIRNRGEMGNIQCLIQEVTGENVEVEPVTLNLMVMGTDRDTGEMVHQEGTAVVKDLILPGNWDVTIDGVATKGYILFSDYVDYSLEVECGADGKVDAMFMSRFHDALPETVVTNFKNILLGYGVAVDNYQSIYHDHTVCGH